MMWPTWLEAWTPKDCHVEPSEKEGRRENNWAVSLRLFGMDTADIVLNISAPSFVGSKCFTVIIHCCWRRST